MRRESHVRFCEGGGVRFPSATRLVRSIKEECLNRLIPFGSGIIDGLSPNLWLTTIASGTIKDCTTN